MGTAPKRIRFNHDEYCTDARDYRSHVICLKDGFCIDRLLFVVIIISLVLLTLSTQADAYDSLDPNGNITITWDVMSWTPDGYVAVVKMQNFQMYRHIMNPGWSLGWVWAKKEVIWSMVGAQTTDQGDCSKFKGNTPHCCRRDPTVVDLLPGVPYNQQISNCCKGGALSSWGQDPLNAVAAFQVSVGMAGTTNRTVKLPRNLTLNSPGPGYTCGPAKNVKPSIFWSQDGRRKTQALMTWNVTCTYSQVVAQKYKTCCVSFSAFYNDTITPCPNCACGCTNSSSCIKSGSPSLNKTGLKTPTKDTSPLLECTRHMCPVRIHWHIKLNYQKYWRVKIAITNFNYRMNYTQWTLTVQHPNLDRITEVFSFGYKPLIPYGSINDSAMFYGIKYYNDMLMGAGPQGNVQSEMLLEKEDGESFTFQRGWAFPKKVYFNGDECAMPSLDAYPFVPNRSPLRNTHAGMLNSVAITVTLMSLFVFLL